MKISKILIIISFLSVPAIIFPTGAMIIESAGDPIEESYIINNLEIETSIVPSPEIEEEAMGEIIFDPDFSGSPLKKSVKPDNYFKSLRDKDKRWHIVEYKVKKNESLWTIAGKFDIPHKMLIKLNNISNPDIIKAGAVIKVPSKDGVDYKIKKGDTLSEIAKKYKIEIDKISNQNNIKNGRIIAGKTIFIPGAVEIQEYAPEKKTAPEQSSRNIAESEKNRKRVEEIDENYISAEDVQNKKSRSIVLSWPLMGPITSGFGFRIHPFSGKKKFHSGLDIGAEEGTMIIAAGDGKVIFEGWKDIYGKMIVVAHKNNYITVYAHNSKNLVKLNDTVKRGDKIALSGKTGAVTGAHLHFEIRKGIVPLNPSRILK
jgi:murein DD-endopeptidase MepM/ murein hydrolase activator NlpD